MSESKAGESPRGREPKRSTQLPAELMDKARVVAAIRGVPVNRLLVEIAGPIIDRLEAEAMANRAEAVAKGQ